MDADPFFSFHNDDLHDGESPGARLYNSLLWQDMNVDGSKLWFGEQTIATQSVMTSGTPRTVSHRDSGYGSYHGSYQPPYEKNPNFSPSTPSFKKIIGHVIRDDTSDKVEFQCAFRECSMRIFRRWPELNRHYHAMHDVRRPEFWCPVQFCARSKTGGGSPFPRKDKLNVHIETLHGGRDDSYPTTRSSAGSQQYSPSDHRHLEGSDSIVKEEPDRMEDVETTVTRIRQQHSPSDLRHLENTDSIVKEEPDRVDDLETTVTHIQQLKAEFDQANEEIVKLGAAQLPFEAGLAQDRGSTASQSSTETGNSDTTYESSDACDLDFASNVKAQKLQLVDRLMLCVHDMFTSTGSLAHNSCAGSESHQAKKQTGGSSMKNSDQAGNKRKGSKESGDNSPDDDENDRSSKHQKRQEDTNDLGQKEGKMLACPYYKCDPQRRYPSNKCPGPGWKTVHRLKEHLYRVHRMPLHCRRCYLTFKTENQLDDHAQLLEACPRREAVPMEGFNKEQEEKLRDRSPMHRAQGSEEKKWQIVYLILFPDTPFGSMPSPYYDAYEDSLCERTETGSPQSSELRRFQEYMKRELPSMVRRTLKALLDLNFASIEETLENRLESIVRDAQEHCARSYLSSMQSSQSSSATIAVSVKETEPAENVSTISLKASSPLQPPYFQMDALAQCSIPDDSSSSDMPHLPFLNDSNNTGATSHDSAYYSHNRHDESLSFDEASLQPSSADQSAFEHLISEYLSRNPNFETVAPDPPLHNQPTEEHTGKGKGRANPDSNPDISHPDFGPFIPDR